MTRTSVTALVAACVVCIGIGAEPPGPGVHPGPAKTIICPSQLSVRLVSAYPAGLANDGWKDNQNPFFVQRDQANPPHISGNTLVCYYRLGNQPGAYVIYQPIGGRKCAVLANGTGFSCSP